MHFSKVKNFSFENIEQYLNQYKDVPWVFYDIETTGLYAKEKITFKNDTFWLHKPGQITQLSASAIKPNLVGRGLNKRIDWSNWDNLSLKEIYYKKGYSDVISDPGEFNEKATLQKRVYNQLTLEKLVGAYVSQFNSTDLDLPRRIHFAICSSVRSEIEKNEELSEEVKKVLTDQITKFNNLSRVFWLSERRDRYNLRREFLICLSRLTSVILKDSQRDLLNNSSYWDSHFPDGTEEEVLINFNSYLQDIKEFGKPLMIGQNNTNFDHKFIDLRCQRYKIPHNNSIEFDLRGVTKYLFHPFIEKNKDSRADCAKWHNSLLIVREDPKKSYLSAKLGDLAKTFDMSFDNWHNSIYDVRMTIKVFFKLMSILKAG